MYKTQKSGDFDVFSCYNDSVTILLTHSLIQSQVFLTSTLRYTVYFLLNLLLFFYPVLLCQKVQEIYNDSNSPCLSNIEEVGLIREAIFRHQHIHFFILVC